MPAIKKMPAKESRGAAPTLWEQERRAAATVEAKKRENLTLKSAKSSKSAKTRGLSEEEGATSVKKSPAKQPRVAVPTLDEQERRAAAAVEAEKRKNSALKSAKSVQMRGLAEEEGASSVKKTSAKESRVAVSTFGEQERRAAASVEAKKRENPALKSTKSVQMRGLAEEEGATSVKKTSAKKSRGVVPSFWEQARRSKAAPDAKKMENPALKSLKTVKSPLELKPFPFPKRPRTFRCSEPPRRFDNPRRD
jgi:hypothetical protein